MKSSAIKKKKDDRKIKSHTIKKENLTANQKKIIFENAEFISLTSFDSNGQRIKLSKEIEDLIQLKILCSF